VVELFGDRVASLQTRRRTYVERAAQPSDYCELVKETFGPAVAIYASLADEPDRVAALDREFLDFATAANSGPDGGPAEYVYEYLLLVASL
jgi:2-polyprenyl-6-hydroxyphenyl methylase/3-demethylubiquinone-9 3-methyltransferase